MTEIVGHAAPGAAFEGAVMRAAGREGSQLAVHRPTHTASRLHTQEPQGPVSEPAKVPPQTTGASRDRPRWAAGAHDFRHVRGGRMGHPWARFAGRAHVVNRGLHFRGKSGRRSVPNSGETCSS